MQRDIDQGVTTEGQHGRSLSEGGDKAVPPRMPRDEGGWRVAPAPDGRGMPEERKPAPKNVEVNAQNPNPGTSLLTELLVGFGPTLLLIGLFWLLARRAQSAAGGGLGDLGTSAARRRAGLIRRAFGSRSPMSPGSTRPSAS